MIESFGSQENKQIEIDGQTANGNPNLITENGLSNLPDSTPAVLTTAESEMPTAAQLAATDQLTSTEAKWQRSNRYGFTLCGFNLLAQQGQYCELLVDRKPARLPNSPAHFRGIVNVRGNLVPLYQLESLLEKPVTRSRYALILGDLAHCAALLIDGKPQTIAESSLQSLHGDADSMIGIPSILKRSLQAASKLDDQIWYTLNHRQLFTELARTFS